MPGLPNFVIIGAAKCGTTSLAHYLDQHPEVQVSQRKELNYFDDSGWRERLDWYRDWFDDAIPRRGEASVSYTMFPEACGSVPERMRELIPDAKLIYLVGDPLERVISQWVMWHTKEGDGTFARAKDAGRPLAEILDEDPLNPYVFPSRYASRLEEFLDCFPMNQLLVMDQEELRANPRSALAAAFEFLQVDRDFASPEFHRHLNQSGDWRRARPGYAKARKVILSAGAERISPSLRTKVGKPLRRIFSPSLERPQAEEVFDSDLRLSLRLEADRLRSISGLPFAGWSV